MSKITLDAETFKALASATRLNVLKALDERRKTLTELSRDLDLNKATVHEHLGLLLAAGLVRKRDDEGRKWIYYELTWTGQRILRPEATTTFNVLLGLSALAAGGGVLMVGRALDWWLAGSGGRGPVDGGAGGSDNSDAVRAADENQLAAPAASSGTSSSTATGTSSSTATGTASATGTQTSAAGSGTGAPAAEGSGDQTVADKMFMDEGGGFEAKDGGSDGFLEDGGWIAVALAAAFFAFCALAWFLHRSMTPKPFDPEAAARAEAESPGPSG